MYFRRLLLGIAATMFCATALAGEPGQRPVTVFAAASLTNVLQRVGDEFTRSTGLPVRLVFAASSVLARQIEAGAGADVFISADQEWMDYLEQRDGVRKSSRRNVLGNRLALIAPASSTQQLEIVPGFPLAQALGDGRLAAGDPDSVPAGRYAKGALTSLGVWHEVADRLVRADDVRQALTFVARGEVPFGIVYATDARIEPRVRTVGIFPAETHRPITYPIALTHRAGADASRFVEFLRGAAGRAVFEQAGFVVLQ
jgi:molybdate transport system substrate-binding protein